MKPQFILKYFHFSRLSALGLFAVVAVWLCISTVAYAASATPIENAEAQPVTGDALVMGMQAEPSNLIPFLSTDSPSRQVASQFYIAPLKYDKNIQIVPWAAESFEVLDGGLRLRFVLRKGLKWQDGVELTTDDVEFTYKTMIDPETPTAYASDFLMVKEFRKIDRHTFEVTYAEPFARSLVTWMSDIVPKHKLEGQDLRTTPLARRPLSAGPYLFEGWQKGSLVTLAANESYFEGRPYIDKIYYRMISDPTTSFLELRAGKVDVMGLTPQQYVYQTDTPEFKKSFEIYRTLSSTYTFMGFNLRSPIFSDKRVRQAIAFAINKSDIVKGALFGQGLPTIGPYKPETWIYNTAIQDRPHDRQKALELLAESGWKLDEGGVLKKDGKPFAFTLLVDQGNETRIKTAVILQSQLQKIGMQVKIRTVEWAAFISQFVNPGFFDALILGWTIPQDPDGYDVWHSSRTGGNNLNFVHFKNAEADDILVKARTTFDQAERKRLYDRFQEILHDEQPYCFLYVPYTLTAVHRRFKGVLPAPAGIFHNSKDWWVPLNEQVFQFSR